MIWEYEPVTSTELVKMSEKAVNWKRSTTHTVIKRLCEKGLFVNTKGIVTSLISRDRFYSMQSKQFVDTSFNGSLSAFIAAYMKGSHISSEEAAETRKMFDKPDLHDNIAK